MAMQAEELNRFKGKMCKISLINGKVKIAKIKRADGTSIALDEGIERNEPAILLSAIIMIKVMKKEEGKDDKKE